MPGLRGNADKWLRFIILIDLIMLIEKQKSGKIFIFSRYLSLLMSLLVCAGPTYVLAQTQTNGRIVSGTVKDAAGEPVIGASVLLKGNTGGTITDLDGKYSIKVTASKGTLVFSYIGYKTVEKEIGQNVRMLDIVLHEDTEMLDEVVVVGYGTMKKKDLTGSVTRIGQEVTENKAATNLVEFLRGTVAGIGQRREVECGLLPMVAP